MDFITEPNRIYAEDETGKLLAEITFPETKPGVCTIDHTFVDSSLRGQGVARRLTALAVAAIRKENKTVTATCSYAQKWLEQHLTSE